MLLKRLSLGLLLSFYGLSAIANDVAYIPSSYDALPGWQNDQHQIALHTFQKSCEKILLKGDTSLLDKNPKMGKVSAWRPVCQAALQEKIKTTTSARAFFEKWFRPYAVTVNKQTQGIFTGYFEPTYRGSLTPSAKYPIPVYGWPKNFVNVNENGKSVLRFVKQGKTYPLPSRTEINAGILAHEKAEILWLENIIDRLFLQIQGSGKIVLENGKTLQVGYAGKNEHPYTAVGKELIARGALTKENVSMQTIRQWLEAHPQEAQEIINKNASFIFFKILNTTAPVGAQGVALTPERSLAVDRKHLALGVPIWLNTTAPTAPETLIVLQRLMIAQDTGSAIQGAIRGDVFWGNGEQAAYIAGHMNQAGQYWVLLPINLTE